MSGLVTDEIRSWIGRSSPPVELEVSRRDIVKYSLATQQTQLHFLKGDEAPPMFLFGADRPLSTLENLRTDGLPNDPLTPPLPLKRVMAGGIEQRYYGKIRPGDKLTIQRKISDIYEKRGKSGPLIFVDYLISVMGSDGTLVLEQKQRRINR